MEERILDFPDLIEGMTLHLRTNGMIKEIAERKHHFTDPGNTYYGSIEENGFLDFHGNRKEASAAFHYRIYDVNLAERICKFVEMLNMEEWEKLVREVKKSEK